MKKTPELETPRKGSLFFLHLPQFDFLRAPTTPETTRYHAIQRDIAGTLLVAVAVVVVLQSHQSTCRVNYN